MTVYVSEFKAKAAEMNSVQLLEAKRFSWQKKRNAYKGRDGKFLEIFNSDVKF